MCAGNLSAVPQQSLASASHSAKTDSLCAKKIHQLHPLLAVRQKVLSVTLLCLLTACGGSGEGNQESPASSPASDTVSIESGAGNHPSNSSHHPSPESPFTVPHPDVRNPSKPAKQPANAQAWILGTPAEASRFLAQATFGSSIKDIDLLKGKSASQWIENEFAKPKSSLLSTLTAWERKNLKPSTLTDAHNAWWYSTIQPDQLRQRIAYSLSQIFVMSSNSDSGHYPKGLASYYDMLAKNAFGNFRTLLEDVALHPMMGIYLTHISNQKERYDENGQLVQAPDENFAREVMQLFTIGLEMLNIDGTPVLDAQGKPIPTYTNDDVIGLARVFTGWSWNTGVLSRDCFFHIRSCKTDDDGRETRPMAAYNDYHSIKEKHFLGTTIGEGQALAAADLKIALDALFNHPNVGPFFARQLIQRLVTSNPSKGYIRRVALAFNDNGNGIRGDMKAVIRAVLLDQEARGAESRRQPTWGRIREPLLRFTHMMRAFNAKSLTGQWPIGITDASNTLNQTAMRAPSVFNFYRPGYSPANTPVSRAGMVAPEMQIIQESSVAGYADYLDRFVGATSIAGVGLGNKIPNPNKNGPDVREIQFDLKPFIQVASNPDDLIDLIDTVMLNGQLQMDTRMAMKNALLTVKPKRQNDDMQRVYRERVSLALYMALLSTDYLVLK